jgi:NAD(P)-dependent dehydrogenase (short-subunit alcohol dehydrogenase family)
MTTSLVVGASRGIGLELARALHARGDTTLGTARGPCPALDALGVRVEALDVTDPASVAAFARRLAGVRLDLVILNAGVLTGESLDLLDFDAVRRQLEVNALGPLRVAAALRPSLRPGSRIGIITSRMGSIADNTSGGAYGYRMSKAAVNAAGRSLAIDLGRSGVHVLLIHPGYVRTDMTGGRGQVDPDASAAMILERLDALDAASSGTFVHANGDPLPW